MRKYILLSMGFLICITFDLLSQSLTELEGRYENLRNDVQRKGAVLDSLKNILENRAHQIEVEKQKQNPDNDKIVNLMAGSVSLSNLINQKQDKLEETTKNFDRIMKNLDDKYSIFIDSLKQLRKSDWENLKKLDSEILSYTEKRLFISPQVELLSFNPSKLLKIDLNKAKSAEEKASLREYLSSALNEVNNLLIEINSQSKEADDAISLQKKTSKFLSETEFDRDERLQNFSKQTMGRIDDGSPLTGGTKENLSDQLNSYLLLLDQINIFDKSEKMNSQKFFIKTNKPNLSLKEYSNLLKEVSQKLNDYKFILNSKLEQSK